MKKCPKCKIEKEVQEYWKTCSYCKTCQKEHWKNRYHKDKKSFAERDRIRWEKKHSRPCKGCKKLIVKSGDCCSAKCKIKSYVKKNRKCWLWIGTKSPTGYGQLSWEGKKYAAHRLAYIVYKGEIGKNLFVCHLCDNPSCVNPEHLFLGTHKDNMKDAKLKKRMRKTVLNIEKSEEIKMLIQKKTPLDEIAKRYQVSKFAIYDIKYGKTWKNNKSDLGA